MNTFKYGLPKDNNGIYNSLTRVSPFTFDELLSWVNEYARVEDDEVAISGVAEHNRGNSGGTSREKFKKFKRKRKDDNIVVIDDGYKGVNTVFTKSIHKIMFDIQN